MSIQIQEPEDQRVDLPVQAIGIDLGTTHSLVAIAQEGVARVLPIDGAPLVPSLVAFQAHQIVCGHAARELRQKGTVPVVSSIKRLMGRGVDDPMTRTFPYPVKEASGRGLMVQVGEKALTPVEISSEILKHLFRSIERSLGYAVTQAVITVPAYFDEAARQGTREAASLAGFEVLRLLSEPTAAALAYGLDHGLEGLYGIFDLGGGTFDFSLLCLEKGVFQVLATGGDLALGGDDFDTAIAQHLWGRTWKNLNSAEKAGLLAEARQIKEALSKAMEVKSGSFELSRSDFEGLIAPLVQQMIQCVASVLEDAAVPVSELKGIVLVGGATRVPLIRAQVAAFLGKEPICTLDPDQVVALGAALQAEALIYGAQHLLLDVTPLSLGLEIMGARVEPLIHRNTRIPVAVTQTFTTAEDGQNALFVHVLQGESDMVGECRSLAQFELRGIPPLPAGKARIDVTFALDTDGLLTVRAQEKTTDIHQEVQVKPSYGLTPEAVREMVLG